MLSPGLQLLALLQEAAVKLRRLARGSNSLSPELLTMADEIAAEASLLEVGLLDEGLLVGGPASASAVDQK